MWPSLLQALTAFLLISDSVSARHERRKVSSGELKAAIDLLKENDSTTLMSGSIFESSDGEVFAPAVPPAAARVIVISTVTVIPIPATTAPGVFYTGIGTGTAVPSGIFWSGYLSGSGSAYPTGSRRTNSTQHHNQTSSLPATSFPFFSLSNTASIPAPTVPSTTTTSHDLPSSSSTTFSSEYTSSAPRTTSTSVRDDPTIVDTTSSPHSTTASTKSSSHSSTTTSEASAPTDTSIPFLRGVNLGGWLVLEQWITPEVFTGDFNDAVDQYTFDSINGASAALQDHWSTYFTSSDFQALAATGINALRIPIGYWAYDNSDTPYIQGADAYLEKAIGWARTAGLKVWVDCHGSPGSQNGFDNSGRAGDVNWQTGSNLNRSISVLKTMAKKYGANEYADVVVGLELVNEPISWGANDFSVTQSWSKSAYKAVREVTENKNLMIVMHDGFEGATEWIDVAKDLGGNAFAVDSHLYQVFTDAYNLLNQAEHITAACAWAVDLKTANLVMPTYVGEWSATTNICVNPDGTTTAGTSCSINGCQCSSDDFDNWNDLLVEKTRRYVEAQLDVWESSTSGYFIWAAKGPGGWGFLNGIEKGIIPNPVTARKYPGQCGLLGRNARREKRGMLGVGGEAF